ncbi:YfgM family protein [Billgrantia gudaonensis]|uniref:Ancillary SecYEG translocon subunit n=1 Tax=Billgrantia gudaonensis TaxID=376427 RepID=A0A1G9A7W1_9GAMM|nr:tetratricopeptide repeat protein [Halomonas gudaonensis]SDK23472.1 Putative negative regulator of RcsB-dependent stress response [Halomonas gudaonensis]
MAELRSEEEQVEALKRWWKENAVSLIAGVAIAIAGVVGWNAWQSYQDDQATAASMRYQQLVNLAGTGNLELANLEEARSLAEEIVTEHDTSLYADLARLIEARLAVQQGDLDGARSALQAVIDADRHAYLPGLARLRLARLMLASDDAEAALDTLESGIPDALAAQRADVRGDAYAALERRDDAREAWREALSLAEQRDQPLFGVELKLDNLGMEEATL